MQLVVRCYIVHALRLSLSHKTIYLFYLQMCIRWKFRKTQSVVFFMSDKEFAYLYFHLFMLQKWNTTSTQLEFLKCSLKTACFKFLQLIFMGVKTFYSLVAGDSSLPCRESCELFRVRNTLAWITFLQRRVITQQPLTWPAGRKKNSIFGKFWRGLGIHSTQIHITPTRWKPLLQKEGKFR